MGTVMIVEDYKSIGVLLREIAALAGYESIATADNGEDALTKYEECSPDVVILDHDLPRIKGLELADWMLRRKCKGKIILCTGRFEEVAAEAEALGIIVVAKPFDAEELIEALRCMHVNR